MFWDLIYYSKIKLLVLVPRIVVYSILVLDAFALSSVMP